jgi:diguanylate cyclase (GGDEF)-like protein
VSNYKSHIAIIAVSLLCATIGFLQFSHDTLFLDEKTRQQIHELKELSLNSESGDHELQRQIKILKIIESLELHAKETSQISIDRFNEQQRLISSVIVLLFLYLTFILYKISYTSKKIAKSNLRIKSEITKIQTTFASIGDAVITTNCDGLVDYMNESAQELTNYQLEISDNVEIQTVFKIFNNDNFLLDNPVNKAISEQRIIKGKHDIFLQRRGGEQLPIVYTIAPIHDSEANIIGTIIVFHDTSETHKMTKALSWQATHDALTKLPNRTLLKDKLEYSLKEAKKRQTFLTLFFIDLDGFKPVNDEYGHQQGDKVLIIIAQRLLSTIRNNDMVARLGGDEFVITLLSLHHKKEVLNALNRVMTAISQPIPVGSANVLLSASIGVTIFPEDNCDADTLLRHADQAMYIAKQKGRNQYHFFDVKSDQVTSRKEKQRTRLEYALKNEEFFLVYQPKVNMRTGNIYGFEALIRWNNPEEGIIYPDKFISLCEDSDLIVHIGDWILDRVFEQLDQWLKSGFDFHIAVNIAPRQFQQKNFISKLDELFNIYSDVPTDHIELEVLESAALQDISVVSEIISACHKRKISVALDDFGTGYASLSYLKQLPADQLKIDRSFVSDMLVDEGDQAIVEGVISLAKIFKRQVIAEGVESKEIGVMLLRLGCDVAQGFGISKPLEVENVLSWAKTWIPDPNWLLWAETPWEISDFPLLVAQSDHITGIDNVIKSVEQCDSQRPLFDLVSHHNCRLGEWYYGIGKEKYGAISYYHELEKPHRETHQLGKEMLHLRLEGKQKQAIKMIPDIIKARDHVLVKLNRLQQEILAQQN